MNEVSLVKMVQDRPAGPMSTNTDKVPQMCSTAQSHDWNLWEKHFVPEQQAQSPWDILAERKGDKMQIQVKVHGKLLSIASEISTYWREP